LNKSQKALVPADDCAQQNGYGKISRAGGDAGKKTIMEAVKEGAAKASQAGDARE
jgi:hypothetical protein